MYLSLIFWKFFIWILGLKLWFIFPTLALFWRKRQKDTTKVHHNCSWNLLSICFWPKVNMQNRTYKKLLNLNLFLNLFCLYYHWNLDKGFKFINKVKILMFEGDWKELVLKYEFKKENWTLDCVSLQFREFLFI